MQPKKYKIAIIATAPFYYHTPLYRKLANSPEVDLMVYYCSEETILGTDIKNAYQVDNAKITQTEDLTKGYPYEFLNNYSPYPSITGWPFGLMNLDIFGKIRNGKYDAIILLAWTDVTRGLAFCAGLVFDVPILFMTDANIFSELSRPMWKKILKKVILGFAFKNTSGFLTAGKANEQLYLHYGVSPKKMSTLSFSWGYEYFLNAYESLKIDREKIRESFGVAKNEVVILYVGRFSEEKGIIDLLDSYHQIKSSSKKLFLVGSGPLQIKIEKHIKAHDIKKVHMMGFQPRESLVKFYILADVLVLPSKDEPWGMVINEAMCFGLPIITSNKVGANLDLVEDGYNGFVFIANDTNDLSLSIQKVIDMSIDSRESFSKRSREIINDWINKINPAESIVHLLKEKQKKILGIKERNSCPKVAIIAPTPFHYHAPFYKKLAENKDIDLMVYYCSDETVLGAEVKKMYLSKGIMAKKEEILNGYKHKFLKNYSLRPSFMNWPFGLVNFGIINELRRAKYDVIIIQSWNNFTWWLVSLFCLFYKIPVVFMTDSNVLNEKMKSRVKLNFKKFILGQFLFKNASGFLTSGTNNEEFYKFYGVPEKKIVRMPFSWGYESFLDESEKISSTKNEAREKMNIKNDDFVILYVGRFSEEKSPMLLLEAYHQIENPRKKLFFVGDGPLRKELEKYITDNDVKRVEFFGFQPKESLFNFYNVADILIMPSKRETWGIVVNEAMCFGLPIIASDRIGVAIDLVKNGVNGFVFEAENNKKLADSIELAMGLPKEELNLLGANSRKMIEDWVLAYKPSAQLKKLLELI